MVLWQGLTEGGTAVPVQVTEDGKVVAQGQQGEKGETGDQGPPGPPGPYGPGDNVEFKNGYFSGNVGIGTDGATEKLEVVGKGIITERLQVGEFGQVTSTTAGVNIYESGAIYIRRANDNPIFRGYDKTGSKVNSEISNLGAAFFRADVSIGVQAPSAKFNVTGTGSFTSDVVVGSRNKQWLLVESGGLCHMIDQSAYLEASTYVDQDGIEKTVDRLKQPIEYPVLRDIQAELTMVEQQLQKVMERLKMVPEAGWEVWDGAD